MVQARFKIYSFFKKKIGNAYIDYDVTDEEMLAALKDVSFM